MTEIADDLQREPRCLDCGYALIGLDDARCPECGRPFDLTDETTYTTRPPLVRWRLWLPGLLLALGIGVPIFALLLVGGGVGFAVTLAAPMSLGAIGGYLMRGSAIAMFFLYLVLFAAVLTSLVFAHLAGVFCAVIGGAVLLIPFTVGALCGVALRERLKSSRFSMRSYLPVILLALVPLLSRYIESRFPARYPVEAVVTSRDIAVPIDEVWHGLRFFEEIEHDPPWLLSLGPQPTGRIQTDPSDPTCVTCVYNKGFVRKRVNEVSPPTLYRFEVLEQRIGEEHSVRLRGGSFALEEREAGGTTVTLTTEYEPRLGPRFMWRPAERYITRLLHEHIIDGIVPRSANNAAIALQ